MTDNAGTQVLNAYDSFGRLRCLIRGASSSSADLVNCTAPSTAQVIKVEHVTSASGCPGKAIVKTIPSVVVAAQVTTTTECLNSNLQVISVRETGNTRDLDGALLTPPTYVSSIGYDNAGRVTERNGPRLDSEAMDKTLVTYWIDVQTPPNLVLNIGHVRSVRRYVGVTGSAIELATLYDQYDAWGVPHLVINPDGSRVAYETSSDRLTWTTRYQAPGGGNIVTTTTVLNADGTVKSQQDGDGVCVTYEYTDVETGKFLGAPTKIRRSNTACGVVPFDVNSGDVEIRKYYNGEPDRLKEVVRKRSGVVEFSISGFQYDVNRRIASSSTLDSASPVTFEYTDVLQTGVRDPGSPAPGAGYTQTLVDNFGRPSAVSRSLGSSASTTSFGYSSPFSGRPTTIVRGQTGSGSTSTFEYDDFGRIIKSVIPESGSPGSPSATRFLYDAGGNMIKSRFGVGTPGVRTSQYTYDSLGRVTFVDHDLEHPVDCATAPAETPIQDEEYKYDSCSDIPPNMFCTNPLGKLTSARVLSQCGTTAQVVRIGRWYAYDAIGRPITIGYATKTGTVVGTAAIVSTSYTAGGRLSESSSPLNSVFGSRYVYDALGDVQEVRTSSTPGSSIAARILGWTTGGWRSFNTPIVQNIESGGSRSLRHRNRRRLDGRLDATTALLTQQDPAEIGSTTLGPEVINLSTQTFTFSPGGALQTRTDTADGLNSRFYGYDALMRLTCEARGLAFPPGQTPTSASCNVTSPSLAALTTYSDGANMEPTDVRKTAFVKSMNSSGSPCSDTNPCYASTTDETGIYSSQSTQLQRLRREPTGTKDLVLGYDQVGRRVFDYEAHDPVESRRDYTYLPNGQLGKITGRKLGHSVHQSFRYDERGRPIRISAEGDFELFYDDDDRLIAAYITSNASKTVVPTRWHYHYLGNTVLAATREATSAGVTTVKRFWFVQDERGLVHRLLDEQGATYWQARWDASGWRTLVGVPQPNMWVPFGLPGQIILDGTQAFAKDSPTSSTGQTRPAIALNKHRSYDPLVGSFTQPDSLDVLGRTDPEGYTYSRHSPVSTADPDGFESQGIIIPYESFVREHTGCSWSKTLTIANAMAIGARQLAACTFGLCDSYGGDNLKRWTMFWLANASIHCLQIGQRSFGPFKQAAFVNMSGALQYPKGGLANAASVTKIMDLPPAAFRYAKEDPSYTMAGDHCLVKTVLHEAMHMALRQTKIIDPPKPPTNGTIPEDDLPGSYMEFMHRYQALFGYPWEELTVVKMITACTHCEVK